MKLSQLFNDIPYMGKDTDILGLTSDSRQVKPGFMFAAIKGSQNDGHKFIQSAIEQGATSILCEEFPQAPLLHITYVVVQNARERLAQAAQLFYQQPSEHLCIVGVTGTNGKTTTTHLIYGMLTAAKNKSAVLGTLGTFFEDRYVETGLTTQGSVELMATLQTLYRQGCMAIAMEVSSHALVQQRVLGMRFNVGVFLNLSHDHLDYHGTMDAYFQAKAKLKDLVFGASVINLDDAYMQTLYQKNDIGFALTQKENASVWLQSSKISSGGMALTIHTPQGDMHIETHLIGAFNIENILAAVATGIALQLDRQAIVDGIQSIQNIPGRLERVSSNVWVDFAHSPDALKKTLQTLKTVVSGRLFCVFGCGGNRDPHKRLPMGQAAAQYSDWAIVTSDNPRDEDPLQIIQAVEQGLIQSGVPKSEEPLKQKSYTLCLDRKQAITLALQHMGPNDGVLIAGKGHETYQIIGEQKLPFDDRKMVKTILEQGA